MLGNSALEDDALATTTDLLPPLEAARLPTVQLLAERSRVHLEDTPALLWEAVAVAHSLVSQLKAFDDRQLTRLNL